MADPIAFLYDSAGARKGEVPLDPDVFGVEPNRDVMHQAVVAHLAGRRAGTAKAKTRAEVRGGGRKPWRQKGLGRARHGSSRSPIWVGGGVAHGPRPRSYAQHTPKKMRALALRSALSARASEGAVLVVDGFDWGSPKTKRAGALLEMIGADGKALMVLDGSETTAVRSFRNLSSVVLGRAGYLNTYDVLRSDTVVFSGLALEKTTGMPAEPLPGPFDVSDDDFIREDDFVRRAAPVEPDGRGRESA